MLEYLGDALSVAQVSMLAYLVYILLKYEGQFSEVGDDISHASTRINDSINHTNTLLDEMIDEAVSGQQEPPMPQGGLIPTLLQAFMSKNPMGLEHGTSEDRTFQEINEETQVETEV